LVLRVGGKLLGTFGVEFGFVVGSVVTRCVAEPRLTLVTRASELVLLFDASSRYWRDQVVFVYKLDALEAFDLVILSSNAVVKMRLALQLLRLYLLYRSI